MMRIVHLILTSSFAGSERHAIELANAQSREHDVTLILQRAMRGTATGAYAHRVDPRVKVLWVNRWLGRWQARRLIRQLSPDVAHAHLSAASKALSGLRDLHARVLRVATLHIRYKPQQHAHLDALVAIAPWQIEAIPSPLREHTVQIDNWTLPYLPAPNARQQLRSEFGIEPGAWVFGSIGRIEHSKGFDLLVDAFERAALPGAYLVIVGQGVGLESLRRRKVPGVILPGFSERPQDWLATFDCFISSARTESFGLVFLEAMAAGLPVIATATMGANHLSTALGGRLVPLQDVAAMAEAIAAVHLEQPPRCIRATEQFSIENKLTELEAFYRREMKGAGLPAKAPTETRF